MKKLLIAIGLIASITTNASNHLTQNHLVNYQEKYVETLGKITDATDNIKRLNNYILYLKLVNTQVEPLKNQLKEYVYLKDYDFSNDQYPNWIIGKYYGLQEGYNNLNFPYQNLLQKRNNLYTNYEAIVKYANENLDEEITIDDYHFVNVNNERGVEP